MGNILTTDSSLLGSPSSSPLKVLLLAILYGSIAFALIGCGLYVLTNQPQCPNDYTQAQVDATGCSVGANIGLGLLVIFGPFGWLLTILGFFVFLMRKKRGAIQKPKNSV